MLFLALCLGLFFPVFAQTTTNDMAPFSGSSQFRKFTIGINAGVLNPSVIFGGSNDFAKPGYSLGYGANLRYQFNHYLALQADYLGGNLKGDQGDKEYAQQRLVQSFSTDLHWAATLSGVLTFGNVNWLSPKTHVLPYASIGIGFAGYDSKIVNLGSSTEVDYVDDGTSPDHPTVVPVGVGLKFNLSKLMNLDLGYRAYFVDADNLDGAPYWNTRMSTTKKDKFSYGFIGLEFALGNQAKEQLLFDNPAARVNSFIQTQVDTVKSQLAQMSNDSDGDGVVDKFDREPNTAAGCPVDVHGVMLDTDGDGVPDCKDKELVTPTQCQPVDADGVGKCPDPACCQAITARLDSADACNLGDLPSISFRNNSNSLSSDAKAMLATVGSKMKESAGCAVVINGYPAASKASQARCNNRLQAIKAYLVETEGISSDRIDVNCEIGGGDANTVDIRSK
jgi:opacity protein-like surface antigen